MLPGYGQSGAPSPAVFRPIHYIGSKLRILGSIVDAIESVAPGEDPVCDLFSGSGTVAMAVAQRRPVIAVDIQEYSRVICSALLCRPAISASRRAKLIEWALELSEHLGEAVAPLIDHESRCLRAAAQGHHEPMCDLVEHGSMVGYQMARATVVNRELASAIGASIAGLTKAGAIDSVDTLITRHFGGVYFSYLQSLQLDCILAAAWKAPRNERDFFVAAVLSTASSIVNTVGKHFAQPIRPRDGSGNPKRHLLSKIEEDRSLPVFSTFQDWLSAYATYQARTSDNLVVRGDYADTIRSFKGQLAAVYADPPYTRDHYSRFYHVLETICRRDNPGVSMMRVCGVDRVSRGLYRIDRHQSPFCIKSQAALAFKNLFDAVRPHQVPLIVSYSPTTEYEGSRPRVMTIDAIRQLALEYFSIVDVSSAGAVSHSKLNSASKLLGLSVDAERLLVCQP